MSILNQKLTLRSDADDQYVSKVAGFVNNKIEEVMEKTKTVSTHAATLLACLNIADELFHHKEAKEVLSVKATKKVKELVEMIDLCKRGSQRAL